jgi:lambda family phage tail tape measure protein
MAINIARLGVVLGIDTAEFTKGIESAKKKLGDIGTFAMRAGAVATAALGAMTYKAMQFADEMSDLSDATGVSIARITQMSQALTMSGGRADDAGKILVKFAQNIDEAASGSQKMQDAFAKVGISLSDLSKLSVEDLLKKASEGIAKIGDKATQTGAKMDLFGKGMRSVDMSGFNNQMAQGTEEFQKYENAIRVAAELNDKLALKASQTSLVFTQKVLPAVNALFDQINVKGGLAEKVFEGIANIVYGMAGALLYGNKAIEAMGVAWDFLKGNMTFEDFQRAQMNIENSLKLGIHAIREYRRELEETKKTDPTKDDAKRTVNDSPEVKKLNEMKRVAGLISEEYERQQSFSLAQMAIREQMVGMTENERKIQESINQVLMATSQKIDEITKKREDAIGRAAPKDIESLKKVYDEEIAQVQRASKEYVDAARIISTSSIETQRTFQFGWDKAFNQFAENAYNYANVADQAFRTVTDNMLSAIDNFVETGKFSFSNFAESVIKDLIKIQLRMQAMQLFSQVGGGLGGIFGGIFGGGGASATTGSFVSPSYGGVAMAADGGMISGPTIVGENGPELFIPQRSGTVIPNQQMSGMAGSQPTIVYNGPYIENMSAIDTQSATQFLAKNKNAVWSANQSASRGMPTSRS